MKFSDKLLSLVIALSMIIALALIAMIFRDLNDLWSALIDYQQIIKSQNDKIFRKDKAEEKDKETNKQR